MKESPELARGISEVPGSFNPRVLNKCKSFHVEVSHFEHFLLIEAKYLHVFENSS